MKNNRYRHILTLAYPVVISQLALILVQLADTVMVGQLGAAPLAAVSFAGNLFFPLFCIGLGFALGLTPLVGEQYAKGNYRQMAHLFQNALLLFTLIGVALVVLMLAAAPLMRYMGQPEEVVEMGLPYFRYMAWSMLPMMVFWAFKQYLEGIGNTKVAMTVIIAANIVNVFLNWLLIYGKWGFEPMGAAGAGLATLIARVIMPVVIAVYFIRKEWLRRVFKFFSWEYLSNRVVGRLVRVGAPITTHLVVECSAFALTGIMVGWIGTTALAATQSAIVVANMAYMAVCGIAAAATIMVSHAYGRGDYADVRATARAIYRIGIVWNVTVAALIVIFSTPILRAFTSDTEVHRIAIPLLVCVAIFQISDGIQANSAGILRGLQDVKSIMKITAFGYIIVCLPVSYLLAFTFGFGSVGIWVGLIIGLTFAAVMLYTRYRKIIKRALNSTPD